jgi:hypothetical protein
MVSTTFEPFSRTTWLGMPQNSQQLKARLRMSARICFQLAGYRFLFSGLIGILKKFFEDGVFEHPIL